VAAQLARRLGAELFLVHVHTPASSPRVAGQAHLIASQRELDSIAADVGELLDEQTKLWVTSGIPAERLAAVGRELGCDLLVIGHGRRQPFARALLGETHRKLLRTADVPVMVVPPAAA